MKQRGIVSISYYSIVVFVLIPIPVSILPSVCEFLPVPCTVNIICYIYI